MDYSTYIVPAVAVAVYLICCIFHYIGKEYPNVFKNAYLPAVAALIGIGLNMWLAGTFDFSIFLGGLASGMAAVGIDQGIKMITDAGGK